VVPCAACERPLTCDACQAEYQPPTEADYHALSQVEEPIICPACGSVLVCHWCKEPYDGLEGEDVSD
jgi:DNA-directed RNA polymerase subunit RPC12/RpoP